MLSEFTHYVEGTGQKSVSVEAGLMDMLQRMESGRFKVFKHLNDWWEEFRLYHRKDGNKEGDDVRYAICTDDVQVRLNSTRLSQLPSQTRISQIRNCIMAEREIVRWFRLRTDYGNCVWCVDRHGLLHVNTPYGSKCTQLGGSEPTFLARLLTKEIVGQAKCNDC